MNSIKSFTVIIVCLAATTLLHAQEIKTERVKPAETKIPAAANNPSPQPGLKPQPQVAAGPAAVAEAPLPLTAKEDAKPEEKPEMKKLDAKAIATPGGEEGRKTLAGKAENTKQAPTTPNTIDHNLKPLPATKAAVLKEQ